MSVRSTLEEVTRLIASETETCYVLISPEGENLTRNSTIKGLEYWIAEMGYTDGFSVRVERVITVHF